ncbi:MAG TPA: phospholipid carrier-dependent glycosyltransferase, partial [Anaerolineae bacterium]|nr:phospholipid carrier-dependent glycosyltransferase [Anaerolineae bacterium]
MGLVYLHNLGGWLINDDEGAFLYQVWRISEGARPYEDLFTSRWPLFLYTGAGWMRIVGAEVVPMRMLSVCLTLGTAVIVFLVARQTLPAGAALLSMVVFLLHPDVFRFGRSFQPEPFYMFFNTLGLYLFAWGQRKGRVAAHIGAGLTFSVASLYKLLAALVPVGCTLFLSVRWLREQESRRRIALQAMAFLLPYVALFSLTAASFMLGIPQFYDSVIGVNLAQGLELTPLQVALKGLKFLVGYLLNSLSFLLLAFPAAWRGWSGDRETALPSWQLPTALAFLGLSRALFPRLLLYLVPPLSVLFAATLEPIRLLPRRSLLLLAIVGVVFIPWTVSDAQMLLRSEQDTMAISRYIQARIPPDAHVLSDYQGLNFYARRPSTYSGAEISYVVAAGGQVTGADLIAEIEEADVKMVLVDVSPQTAHQ